MRIESEQRVEVREPEVGVDHHHALAAPLQRDREIGDDVGLADPALAARDRDHLHARRLAPLVRHRLLRQELLRLIHVRPPSHSRGRQPRRHGTAIRRRQIVRHARARSEPVERHALRRRAIRTPSRSPPPSSTFVTTQRRRRERRRAAATRRGAPLPTRPPTPPPPSSRCRRPRLSSRASSGAAARVAAQPGGVDVDHVAARRTRRAPPPAPRRRAPRASARRGAARRSRAAPPRRCDGVSAITNPTEAPRSSARAASLAMVVVLPAPVGPTNAVTRGSGAAGAATTRWRSMLAASAAAAARPFRRPRREAARDRLGERRRRAVQGQALGQALRLVVEMTRRAGTRSQRPIDARHPRRQHAELARDRRQLGTLRSPAVAVGPAST